MVKGNFIVVDDEVNLEDVIKEKDEVKEKDNLKVIYKPKIEKYEIVSTHYVQDGVDVKYPQITGLENKGKEEAINLLIKNNLFENWINDQVEDVRKTIEEYGVDDAYYLQLDYEVTISTGNVLSILYTGEGSFKTSAFPSYAIHTTTIDFEQIKLLSLSNFIDVDNHLLEEMKLSENIMNESIKLGASKEKMLKVTKDAIDSWEGGIIEALEGEPSGYYTFAVTSNSLLISISVFHAGGDYVIIEIPYEWEIVEDNNKTQEDFYPLVEGQSYAINSINYTQGQVNVNYPQISGLENSEQESAINALIKNDLFETQIDNYVEEARIYAENMGVENQLILTMDYEITLSSNNILSILYTGEGGYTVSMHLDDFAYGVTIDLEQVKILSLSDFITIDDTLIEKLKASEVVVNNIITENTPDILKQDILSSARDNIASFEDDRIWFYDYLNTWSEFVVSSNSLLISMPVIHAIGDYALIEISYEWNTSESDT
jgi:hypothetical protein